jgi:hypothetical protein
MGFAFVSIHAYGSMYTYHSAFDVVPAKFEELADPQSCTSWLCLFEAMH